MCVLVYVRACMHMDGWMDGWLQAVGVGVSFRVMDLGWKLPCIVRIFFFFTSMASRSSFGHLTIPDVYLLPSNVYIDALALITTIQLAFQHLSYLLEVFDCG